MTPDEQAAEARLTSLVRQMGTVVTVLQRKSQPSEDERQAIMRVTEWRNELTALLGERRPPAPDVAALIAKWRDELHTFEGKSLQDINDHAAFCTDCRIRLRFIADLEALWERSRTEAKLKVGTVHRLPILWREGIAIMRAAGETDNADLIESYVAQLERCLVEEERFRPRPEATPTAKCPTCGEVIATMEVLKYHHSQQDSPHAWCPGGGGRVASQSGAPDAGAK